MLLRLMILVLRRLLAALVGLVFWPILGRRRTRLVLRLLRLARL
jgi:hypothetical protein